MSTITFITDATINGPVHYPLMFNTDDDSVRLMNIFGDTLILFDSCCQVFRDKEQKNLIGRIERNGKIFRFVPVDKNTEGFQVEETSLKDFKQGNKYIDFEIALAGHFLSTGKYDLAVNSETLKTRHTT